MDQALPKKLWDQLGLVSILDTINRLSLCLSQDSVKNLSFAHKLPHLASPELLPASTGGPSPSYMATFESAPFPFQ